MENINIEDLLTAAQTIVMEAGNESYQGQVAVAWVLANRLDRPMYFKQSTLWGVCHAPLQFSCWNNSLDRNLETTMALPFSHPRILEALSIVIRVFLGREPDPTRGADHYFATYIPRPNWANESEFTAQVGVHRFYKLANK